MKRRRLQANVHLSNSLHKLAAHLLDLRIAAWADRGSLRAKVPRQTLLDISFK